MGEKGCESERRDVQGLGRVGGASKQTGRSGIDEELRDGVDDLLPELLDVALGVAVHVPAEREPQSTGKRVREHEHASWSLSGTEGEVRRVDLGVGGVCGKQDVAKGQRAIP